MGSGKIWMFLKNKKYIKINFIGGCLLRPNMIFLPKCPGGLSRTPYEKKSGVRLECHLHHHFSKKIAGQNQLNSHEYKVPSRTITIR